MIRRSYKFSLSAWRTPVSCTTPRWMSGGKLGGWAGQTVTAVNPRHTSQRCAQCGHIAAGNRVTQAEFRCLACGHQAHADINAARNILRAGLALQEA
jgi:putative transposase